MADPVIINSGATRDESSNALGMIAGVLALFAVVFLLLYFGLPALRRVSAPQVPSISVPEQIDVNVNTTQP